MLFWQKVTLVIICSDFDFLKVTGDHPVTAAAIARAVGIISPDSRTIEELAEERQLPADQIDPRDAKAFVIHGTKLKEMSDRCVKKMLMNPILSSLKYTTIISILSRSF